MVVLLAGLASASGAWADPRPGAGNRSAPPVRTDRYGDPLPEGVLARLGTLRFRAMPGASFYLSPDEKTLAMVTRAGIRLCDARTGRLLRRLRVESTADDDGFEVLGFSGDGLLLATGTSEAVALWDVTRGRQLWEARLRWPRAAFATDGKHLLVASAHERTVQIREAATGKVVSSQRIPGSVKDIPLAVSADGKGLAADTGNHAIAVCAPLSDKRWRTFPVPDKMSSEVALARKGNTLVAAGLNDGKWLRVWSLPGGTPWPITLPAEANPFPLHLSEDGGTVGSYVADDKRERYGIYLWRAGAAKAPRFFRTKDPVGPYALSPSGRLLAVAAPPRIVVWETATARKLLEVRCGLELDRGLFFSADEKRLHALDDQAFRSWDIATGRELHALPGETGLTHTIAFSGNGRVVATGGLAGPVRVWDAATGRQLQCLPGEESFVSNLALSGDGSVLASYSDLSGFKVYVWDVSTARVRNEFVQVPIPVMNGNYGVALDLSPDGRTVAVTSIVSPSATVWDAAAGKVRHELSWFGYASGLALSPDGRTLAIASQDSVDLWDAQTGQRVTRPTLSAKPKRFTRLRFSPDGRMLAALNETRVEVWELASRRRVGHFRRPRGLCALAFTPQGRLLAAEMGSDESRVDVWDVLSDERLKRCRLHEGQFAFAEHWHTVVFSPDGHLLATALEDTTALVWDMRPLLAGAAGHATPLGAATLGRYWNDLAGKDAARACEAVRGLTAAPGAATAFLKQRLKPQAVARYPELIARLDSKHFTVRSAATKDLARLGIKAEPTLRAALSNKPSLETRQRVERLLRELEEQPPPPEVLRGVRSVQVLEQIGSPAARDVLQLLATGDPDAWLTREAKASLNRLRAR
jgi:WD40 repeat protein